MHAVSAMPTWAIIDNTLGPPRPSDSTAGSTSAADDDAISTPYSAACPVPNHWAISTPSAAAHTPTRAARTTPPSNAGRSLLSPTGTCDPATNITSAKPMSARKVNVGSAGSSTARPLVPNTMPPTSSPSVTGRCQRPGVASSGPSRPTAPISASVAKSMPAARVRRGRRQPFRVSMKSAAGIGVENIG